jgi:hypothetical protein
MSLIGTILGLDGLPAAAGTIASSVGGVVQAEIAAGSTAADARQNALAERYKASATIAAADAKSDSWLTRITRPAMVWWAMVTVSALCVTGYFDPLGAKSAIGILNQVPDKFWEMIGGGTGVYFVGRTAEKVTSTIPSIIAAIRNKL